MNTQHTPTPWHVGMNPGPIIYGPLGEQVADPRGMLDYDEVKLNAALIVKAVNSHGAMVSAARWAMEREEEKPAHLQNKDLAQALRAALALAGE